MKKGKMFLTTLMLGLFCASSAVFAEDVPYTLAQLQELQKDSPVSFAADGIMGECYIQGNCVFKDGQKLAKNTTKGLQLLERAAEKHPKPAFNVGDYYLNGTQGVEKDYVKAHKYLQKAADAGDERAMYLLAAMYMTDKAKPDGSAPADLVAMGLLMNACQKGLEEACAHLSVEEDGNVTNINIK